MTFTGLLPAEEAVACAKVAPHVEWLAYVGGAVDDRFRGLAVRALYHDDPPSWTGRLGNAIETAQGFAPVPGHWLPMFCAPIDREVLVAGWWDHGVMVWSSRFDGEKEFSSGARARSWKSPTMGWLTEASLDGWAPIVLPTKEGT